MFFLIKCNEKVKIKLERIHLKSDFYCTVCPRSPVHFYVATHRIKMDNSSWTDDILTNDHLLPQAIHVAIDVIKRLIEILFAVFP